MNLIVLLALDDEGAPSWHAGHARTLVGMGAPVFACTPVHFPGLMAAALEGRDLSRWASEHALPGV